MNLLIPRSSERKSSHLHASTAGKVHTVTPLLLTLPSEPPAGVGRQLRAIRKQPVGQINLCFPPAWLFPLEFLGQVTKSLRKGPTAQKVKHSVPKGTQFKWKIEKTNYTTPHLSPPSFCLQRRICLSIYLVVTTRFLLV